MNSHMPPAASVLLALFDLSRVGIAADVHRVAGRLGLSIAQVRHALVALEERRLADAQNVRLSMLGLALATVLDARRTEQRRESARRDSAAA